MFDHRFYYRRNLPHYQPKYATVFVTFRLAGSIPVTVLEQIAYAHSQAVKGLNQRSDAPDHKARLHEEQRRAFGKWDAALHTVSCGPRWLEDPRLADLVAESLRNLDGSHYDLLAYCVMPNHVHAVFTPLLNSDGTTHSLAAIMHSLKRHTARKANLILGRQGEFWQHENYDHVVRDEGECARIVAYVLNNPVKAGLVDEWQDWPWSYLKS